MRVSRPAVFLSLLAFAAGCHSYRPASLAQLHGGERVRTLLTPELHEELDEHLLGGDRLVEGTVVDASADGMLLEVPVVTVAEGIQIESYSQRLRIPADGVADIELRSLDRARSYSLGGVVVAALGGIAWNIIQSGRQGKGDPPPPPVEDRVVIISIPFSIP